MREWVDISCGRNWIILWIMVKVPSFARLSCRSWIALRRLAFWLAMVVANQNAKRRKVYHNLLIELHVSMGAPFSAVVSRLVLRAQDDETCPRPIFIILYSFLLLVMPVSFTKPETFIIGRDRKSTRLNSSHQHRSRMPSSA